MHQKRTLSVVQRFLTLKLGTKRQKIMLISTITSKLRKAITNDVIVALERPQIEKELYSKLVTVKFGIGGPFC